MRATLLSFVLLFGSALPSLAQSGPTGCPRAAVEKVAPPPAVIAARKAEHQTCAADMAHLCASVPRGCGRPMQCLRAHAAELSADCTNAMAQLRTVRAQSR